MYVRVYVWNDWPGDRRHDSLLVDSRALSAPFAELGPRLFVQYQRGDLWGAWNCRSIGYGWIGVGV